MLAGTLWAEIQVRKEGKAGPKAQHLPTCSPHVMGARNTLPSLARPAPIYLYAPLVTLSRRRALNSISARMTHQLIPAAWTCPQTPGACVTCLFGISTWMSNKPPIPHTSRTGLLLFPSANLATPHSSKWKPFSQWLRSKSLALIPFFLCLTPLPNPFRYAAVSAFKI